MANLSDGSYRIYQPRTLVVVAVCIYYFNSLVAASASTTSTSTLQEQQQQQQQQQQRYTVRLPPTAKYYPKDIDDLIRQYDNIDINDASEGPAEEKKKKLKPIMKLPANGGDEGQKYYDFDSFISFSSYNNYDQGVELEGGKLYLPVNAHILPEGVRNEEEKEEEVRGYKTCSQNEGWTSWFKFKFNVAQKGLEKRQQSSASCPSGNSACSNIQKPGFCCPTDTTCVNIQDTGFGSVGCCPDGQPCGDSLNSCSPGYFQCPQGSGGGCCLPGYICSPQGCLINTSSISNPPKVTTTGTITVGLDLCQGGYYPCPASLSYGIHIHILSPKNFDSIEGCCQIGYLCGVTDCPYNTGPGTPGTEYASAGFTIPTSAVEVTGITYPTSGFSTIDIATVTDATAAENTAPAPKITNAPGALLNVPNCPAGWLACGAQFNGGCCRVGRDCGTSYCPVGAGGGNGGSSDIVTLTTNGACPGGWFECPLSVSRGCCPSGYGCGVLNCPATTTVNGGVVVVSTAPAAAKVSPVKNGGMMNRGGSGTICIFGLVFWIVFFAWLV
ncbi:hypothetical protein AA313_de0208856 [Arthrobotrys entomopaga]|nr:hypothetical protein AA313_de0208856 [Arthrobotrys entomopaga]